MPNGYRRGGTYRRNGRTFQRRGTTITGRGVTGVVIGLVCLTTITGGSLVGSPALVAVAGCALLGVLAWRYRRQLAPVGRRMLLWAEKRAAGHGQRPTLVAKVRR